MASTAETVDNLSPEVQKALLDLVGRIGAAKHQLGRRFEEWCTGAPTVEAAVAASSMAQEELGHSRVFLGVARGVQDHDAGEGLGGNEDMAPGCLATPFTGWIDFVATALVADTGLVQLLEALEDCEYGPVRQRVRKALIEEEFHGIYARGWRDQLLAEGGRIAETLRAKVEECVLSVGPWLAACEQDLGQLKEIGARAVPAQEQLHGRLWGN